jgi:hypothetical protein
MMEDDARRQVQQRLARLRAQAGRCGPAERRPLSSLLDQEPFASDLRCPRYLAIAMNAGQRRLVVGEEQDALGEVLSEMAAAEPPWTPQTLIDLQSAERSHARISVRFIASTRLLPPLVGDVLELDLEDRRGDQHRDTARETRLEHLRRCVHHEIPVAVDDCQSIAGIIALDLESRRGEKDRDHDSEQELEQLHQRLTAP